MADDTFNPINDETPASVKTTNDVTPPVDDETPADLLKPPTPPNTSWGKKRIGFFSTIAVTTAVVLYGLLEAGVIPPVSEWYQPDHSQTLEEAYAAGAPRIDTPWTLEDYQAFEAYVTSLPTDAYPRSGSKKSSALFDKFINSTGPVIRQDALTTYQGAPVPSVEVLGVIARVSQLYLDAAKNRQADYSLEIAHGTGMTLLAARQLLETYTFVDEQMLTMRPALAKMLKASVASLTTAPYSDDERAILATYLRDNRPTLYAFLTPSDQATVLEQAKAVTKTVKGKRARALLKQFVAKLEGTR